MKPPADGWDETDREILALVEQDLPALRRRHAHALPIGRMPGPALEVLDGSGDPSSRDPWNRALLAGVTTTVTESEPELEPEVEERILARVRAAIREEHARQEAGRAFSWRPALAMAATVVLAAAALLVWVSRQSPAPSSAPQLAEQAPPAPVPAPVPAPEFVLTLQKPDVTISASSLTWRSDAVTSSLLDHLKGPLDAYRQDDYASAVQQLEPLTARYPRAVEPWYYLGLSRLLSGDAAGAVTPLSRAEALADDSLADDATWYLAVAYERSGRLQESREALSRVCGTGGRRAAQACDAAAALSR